MQDILFSLNIVAPLFILVAVGYFLTQIKFWDDNFLKIGNKLCFNVLLPVMLFHNISKSDFFAVFDGKLIIFTLASVTLLFFWGVFLIRFFTKDGGRRAAIVQALFRGNYLLLGVPICASMFGDEGAVVASVSSAFVIPYFNILATILLSIYSRDKVTTVKGVLIKIAKNPLIIGCVLGIVASLVKLPIPETFDKAFTNIKSIATPFALLILGGDFKFRELKSNLKPVVITTLLRLIIVPAAIITAAVFFGFSGVSLGVLIAVYCTPVAVSSYPMTRQMNGDYELAGQLIVSTTFLSMFTIFIFVYGLRLLGLA